MNLATSMLLALAAQAAAAAPAPAPAGEAAWKVVCPPAAAEGAAAQPCSLMQNLVAGDKQQRLLTVLLNRQGDGHGMTIALPHGVLFVPGVSVQVDDAAETRLAVQTSDQNGAYKRGPPGTRSRRSGRSSSGEFFPARRNVTFF